MAPAIEVVDLRKSYGDNEAVRGISFTVGEGEVLALLGPNGAGKTTTVEILEGYRARTAGETEGFVKIIADARTDRVLGVHILGPRASDLIAEAVAVMEFAGSAEDIARTCHAHPTLSEVVREAALSVDRRAIHA